MGWRPRLLCCLFLSLSLAGLGRAATWYQEWEIGYQFSPDCVRKLAVTINGQTPGPTIRATQGDADTVVVRVKNSLFTENVAIHWHGIRQHGTPWADRTEGVTQCPILPGDTFVVDRQGTYMYFVVAAEPFRYDGDGHYVKPFVVKNLTIYSGHTYSVLIKADRDPNRNYWLATNVVSCEPATPTGTAVLSYYGGRSSPRKPPPTTPPTVPAWNDTMYRFRQSVATVAHLAHIQAPPPRTDRTILLLNTQNKIDGRIKWALNNVSFTLPRTPYLMAMKCVTQCPILPEDTFIYTFVVDCRVTYTYQAQYGMQRSVELNGMIAVATAPGGPDAEPSEYDGEHNVWVREQQSLLIDGRGRFVNCSAMAVGACNATLRECATPVFAVVPSKTYRFRIARVTSLSALNFEIEDGNARLISYPAPAVHSGGTSSRRPPMGYQQYGAALVAVMLCLFLGEFLGALYLAADQNPAADESTIARSGPAGSASGSLPVGGGHTPFPSPASASSPSSTDPAYSNRSSATSSTSGEETVPTEEDPGGPPGSPPQRPAVPLADNVEGPLLTFVLAVFGYDVAAAVGILTEFEHIVGTWSTAAEVVYGVLTVVGIALLAIGLMAAGWHARAGNSNKLSVSAFCAKLGAILFTSLLVVAFSCRLGPWARVAAVPSAAVVACIMAAVWIWGDEHAVANAVVSTCWGRLLGQRREREPAAAGDDMV